MTRIVLANTAADLDQVRGLLRSFRDWHLANAGEMEERVRSYLPSENFERELKDLPGAYTPPFGALLLAIEDDTPAGCVALRPFGEDNNICEMKRMFVRPEFQGKGIGRALALRLMAIARSYGYKKISLDTGSHQTAALGLYRGLGFRLAIPHAGGNPEFSGWLTFLERDLVSPVTRANLLHVGRPDSVQDSPGH
jgi:ribosomal protein S18 acetylase RimI-like enzyme